VPHLSQGSADLVQTPGRSPRGLAWGSALALVLGVAAGCGTTRVTNTQRAATEQLLVSNAIDQSVSQLDFRALAGKPVFLDAQYLAPGADQGYVVSSLRQQLLACGCLLQEGRAQATYVVEARSGGIGTDQHSLLFGVPQMNVPSVLPGQPSLIPEIPLAKKTDQKGVAKIAVFAYNRRTGRPVWQSGVVQAEATSKDTWVLGAGPFRRGTLGEATDIAGAQVSIPLLSGKEGEKAAVAPVLAVTRPAIWEEPSTELLSPYRLPGADAPVEPGKASTPPSPPALPPSVESPGGAPSPKAAATPAKAAGAPTPPLSMEPIRFPPWLLDGAGDASRPASGSTTGQPAGKDATPRKATIPPAASGGAK
jgi:hypothetical protein